MPKERAEAEVDEQFVLRLGKMLSDSVRMSIVCECNIRPLSPRGFREEFGGPSLAKLAATFRELAQFDWLEPLPPEEGGTPGEFDRRYRTIQSLIFEEPVWSALPGSVRSLMTSRLLEGLSERARAAVRAGTFDARPDSHVSWTPLTLDEQGWEAATAKLDALFYWLFEEQERADERLAASGEESVAMTVALLGFESPKPSG
jgi:hypothetical protein